MRVFILIVFLFPFLINAQEFRGPQATSKVKDASVVRYKSNSEMPDYVSFLAGSELPSSSFVSWMKKSFRFDDAFGIELLSTQTDQAGMTHNRYRQMWNGIPVENGTIITHEKNNLVYSWNGSLQQLPTTIERGTNLTAEEALESALNYVNAEEYRWQNAAWETHIKSTSNDPAASWYPTSEEILVKQGDSWTLAWRFDIYASKPFSRQYVFVAVSDGTVLKTIDRIRNTDVPGTAITKYSGTKTITTDQVSPSSFRLRESSRGIGLGMETYDLNNSTDPGSSVDFTDSDNTWNNVNAQQDEVATDAHWGTEMVYDYFYNRYGRNSLDNAGKKLFSYVHYDSNWANAMWDGTAMYYGDGDNSQGITPLTTIDICGHEVTHGLTEYTANLIYAEEPGALNESFSDIFGVSIRYYAKPSDFSWQIGDEMGWVIRDMADPNNFNQPDTYLGDQWDPWQEVHTNSGVMNFWFYLLSEGGSGTNDNGDAYSVSAITIDSAASIAFHTLTDYLVETSEFMDARFYSIIAASDLFGDCSPEVIAVTNAWYAVGVGGPFNPEVTADFTTDDALGCKAPHVVNFDNTSTTATTFSWTFGDGGSSTDIFPTHTYTATGTYTVKLIADGGACGRDTTEKVSYIFIDSSNPCDVLLPANGTAPLQTSCMGILMDDGGDGNYSDDCLSTITISPTGVAQVTIVFTEFELEDNYDYLYIYNGTNTSAPLIGAFTGNTLPNGGTITSSGPSITIRFSSDSYLNEAGFRLTWECIMGVEDSNEGTAYLYPNPAEDIVSVKLTDKFSGDVSYKILDMSGKSISQGDYLVSAETLTLPVGQMAPGYYYLVLVSDTETLSLPFVKQ